MVGTGDKPGPQSATTAAEFVGRMAALRAWSGFTYRQLQHRAQKAGKVLPHSTLASALSRSQLPREELVEVFTLACGLAEDEIAAWVETRKRIAAASARTPEPVTVVAQDAIAAPADATPADATPAATEPATDRMTDPAAVEHNQTEPDNPAPAATEPATAERNQICPECGAENPPTAAFCTAEDCVALLPFPHRNMLDDAAEMPASQEEHTERLAIVAFTEGGLGAAVREADDGSRWSGLHRRRTPKVEPAAPRGPVMMREFLPPVMFVRGWRARLVQGALVCLIALVAAGFVMRFRGERTPEPVAGSESAGEATLELTLDKVCLSAQKHTWQIKVTGTATAGQIGQLLRHEQQDTTRIYAKVDLDSLRGLGLPWAGGGQ